MNSGRKQEIVYALFSAIIYTIVYVILRNLDPGVGFQNSMIARFEIGKLLLLAFYFLIFSFAFVALIAGCLIGISSIIFDKMGIPEVEYNSLVGLLASIPIILFFAVAFGFISIGVL